MIYAPPYTEVIQNSTNSNELRIGDNRDSKNIFNDWTSTTNSTNSFYQFANHKFIKSIELINSFKKLKPNWDTYNGLEINTEIIHKSIILLWQINNLVPDIFPTGRGSIQFEFERKNGDYLEFEIFQDEITYFIKNNKLCEEGIISKTKSIESLIKEYNDTE